MTATLDRPVWGPGYGKGDLSTRTPGWECNDSIRFILQILMYV